MSNEKSVQEKTFKDKLRDSLKSGANKIAVYANSKEILGTVTELGEDFVSLKYTNQVEIEMRNLPDEGRKQENTTEIKLIELETTVKLADIEAFSIILKEVSK